MTLTLICPASWISSAARRAEEPLSLSYTMTGAFILAGGSVLSTAGTCATGMLTAPGMKPSRATVEAGRTSMSTCGMSLPIHASLRNGALITPTFFSSHSGTPSGYTLALV